MLRSTLFLGFLAIGAQGCIIYADGCDDCGWGDWDDRWSDDDCDDDDDDVCQIEPDPEPEPIAAWLDPDFAERGQTFAAHLMFDGDVAPEQVTAARFSGGVDVRYVEPRAGDLLLLIDVPLSAELGPADLSLQITGRGSVTFPGVLTVGGIGDGSDDEPCE